MRNAMFVHCFAVLVSVVLCGTGRMVGLLHTRRRRRSGCICCLQAIVDFFLFLSFPFISFLFTHLHRKSLSFFSLFLFLKYVELEWARRAHLRPECRNVGYFFFSQSPRRSNDIDVRPFFRIQQVAPSSFGYPLSPFSLRPNTCALLSYAVFARAHPFACEKRVKLFWTCYESECVGRVRERGRQ